MASVYDSFPVRCEITEPVIECRGEQMIQLPMSQILSNITVNVRVTGHRRAAIRIWIGTKIIEFGVYLLGSRSQIDMDIRG